MSYDASAQALRCPFCGSTQLDEKPDRRVLAPERVVPFAISRELAERIMQRWLGRGFWRPRDILQTALVTSMTPVFVPFWSFQATTDTNWTADTNELPPFSTGIWRPLFGEHQGQQNGVLVGASGVLTARETSALGNYDLSKGVLPYQADLDNITVEEFEVSRKYARPLAYQALEDRESATCDVLYVPGKCRNLHVNVRVTNMESEPVLLPVWIVAYRYRDRVFRFLVNGQTGQESGEAPTSWAKAFMIAGFVMAAVAIAVAVAALAR
jgi:hypothetical protein